MKIKDQVISERKVPTLLIPFVEKIEKKVRKWEQVPVKTRKKQLIISSLTLLFAIAIWLYCSLVFFPVQPLRYYTKKEPGFHRKKETNYLSDTIYMKQPALKGDTISH